MGIARSLVAAILVVPSVAAAADHLLITEIAVTVTDAEFVEIYNPTSSTIDLSDYYLTDAVFEGDNDYVNVVDGTYTPWDTDFLARFPAGASIAPGEALTVAVNGAAFEGIWGTSADFELHDSGPVADMVDPGPGWIGSSNALITNSREVMILFHWDGMSDLVEDVDIVLWGGQSGLNVDKTGVAKDGPDADTDPSTYADDTPWESQKPLAEDEAGHEAGKSFQRVDCMEMSEVTSGGNGISGHDETSEDLTHWTRDLAGTPGMGPGTPDCGATSVQSISWSDLKARFTPKNR